MKNVRLKTCCGVLAAAAWILFGITGVIRWIAGDSGLLGTEMLRAAPPEATGLRTEDYAGVAVMTADFLTGKQEAFRYVVAQGTGSGTACARTEVFQPHEAAHMADCRQLIRLDTGICMVSGIAALLLTAAGLFRWEGREGFQRGMLWGLRGTAAAAGVLLAWALADFDGLFVAFHHLAFPQGGWLLNPKTDLLIRLMPTAFFVRLGIRGLLRFAALPVVLAACAHAARRKTIAGTRDKE